SSNGRIDLWKAAAAEAGAHPVLGGGAGSYEAWGVRPRDTTPKGGGARPLYMQPLAEVGPLGLLLLVVALAVPLVAGIRARRHPLVPAALAAYLAYLVPHGIDW